MYFRKTMWPTLHKSVAIDSFKMTKAIYFQTILQLVTQMACTKAQGIFSPHQTMQSSSKSKT